jgi:GDP-4-dehydro-6-deoxy-D-mannose reductase
VPKRILVTGISGFSGRHLAERLHADGDAEVAGLGASPTTTAACRAYFACDLTDPRRVEQVVEAVRPEVVYHLAALTAGAALELHRVNVGGFMNLCDALRRVARTDGRVVRLLAVGSAAELGSAGVARLPVSEDAPCEPESEYGRSKWEVARLAAAEPVAGPLQIIVARSFNLAGPGMGSNLALGRFVEQIAAYRRGEIEALRCGNLAARRDFVDVRDAAAAYVAIARRGRAGERYNVCRGASHAVGDLLAELIAASGLSVPVVGETGPPRPGDVADVYGDPAKTRHETGWQATTPIQKTLNDLLTHVNHRAAAA